MLRRSLRPMRWPIAKNHCQCEERLFLNIFWHDDAQLYCHVTLMTPFLTFKPRMKDCLHDVKAHYQNAIHAYVNCLFAWTNTAR